MEPAEALATLPTISYYEAALTGGGMALLRINRQEYPASEWSELFEMLRTEPDLAALAYKFSAYYLAAINHALPAVKGMDQDAVTDYVTKNNSGIARLCRALADNRGYSDNELIWAGITRLTPLPITDVSEWLEQGRVPDAAR